MTRYKNLSGNSGVAAYEIRDQSIVIEFKYKGRYIYNYDRPGREHVEEMKKLAIAGRELATYISKNVRRAYARKL